MADLLRSISSLASSPSLGLFCRARLQPLPYQESARVPHDGICCSTSHEIDAAFTIIGRDRPDAIFVGETPFLNARRMQMAQLATRHIVPALYSGREFPEGLMSYGSDIADAYRQVGIMPVVFSRARSLQICRWYRQTSLSLSSMPKPPECLGSSCQHNYLRGLTRWSNKLTAACCNVC